MDPNEALRIIRAAIAQMKVENPIGTVTSGSPLGMFVQHSVDLAEAVEGLDEWLSRDGVLPTEWLAEEDKPKCYIEHGDWTGPHYRITSCPVVP